MSDTVLKVENLSKRFWIGAQKLGGARYIIEQLARNPLKLLTRPKVEEFWALKDLNFEVKAGERVAMIGRNGAGKSTLLKVISRITPPTTGAVSLRGRVGSLLEVGTGFHPELTGRENIFLNGALLGMRRSEIQKNFDAIVDFAEVSQFLDTPVKRYSSGMYVRLAFAVAAHLQTEILIVDEVLAVGDSRFQKKCVEKMNNVSKEGCAILFVSHNTALMQSLCSRGILLEKGQMIHDGPIGQTLDVYQHRMSLGRADGADGIDLSALPRVHGLVSVLKGLRILNEQGVHSKVVELGKKIALELDCDFGAPAKHLIISIKVSRPACGNVFHLNSHIQHGSLIEMPARFNARVEFVLPNLVEGEYNLALELRCDGAIVDEIPFAGELEVQPSMFYSTGFAVAPQDGPLLLKTDWSFKK